MAAELITESPRLGTGLGQLLDGARQLFDASLALGMIVMILVVGVAVDRIVFSPPERGVLRRRGLLVRVSGAGAGDRTGSPYPAGQPE